MKTITYILIIILLCIGCDSTKRVQRKSHDPRLKRLEYKITHTQPHQHYRDRPNSSRFRNVSGHTPFLSYPTPRTRK